jgi:hypothetical protein
MPKVGKRNKPDESFVERPQEETQSKARRISLRVDEDGAIDWSQSTEQQKEAFFEAISKDPDTLEKVAASLGEDGEIQVGPVTEDHVKTALTYYAKGEALLIPYIIKKKSKGLIKVDPEFANKVFAFEPEELNEMAPDGAQFANEEVIPHLPEWMSNWITELGPGEKFLGALVFHTFAKTTALLNHLKTQPQTVEGNAQPTTETASGTNGSGAAHVCPVENCGKYFATAWDLGHHITEHGTNATHPTPKDVSRILM